MLSDTAHREVVKQRLMVQNSTVNQLGNKWWIQLASQALPNLTCRTQDATSGRPHPDSHFFPGLRILRHLGRHARVLWTSGMFKKYSSFQKQAHEPIHFSRMAKRWTRFNMSKEAEFPLSGHCRHIRPNPRRFS